MPLALYVKSTLGLDYAFANNLEISPDGQFLTGKVSGTIVNGEKKADFLRVIAALENVPTDQVIALYCFNSLYRLSLLEMERMIF